ncbi:MAG: HAD family hydrolase [Betaproteobacteria bacterium]|nr:MAG: HAD family hydrolase [Betaproteobacteria bacterium]
MLSEGEVVFLLDVDNTLLDNDRFVADLGARLEQAFGANGRDRYWAILAALREELSYVDYLGALEKFRVGLDDDPDLLQMSAFMLEYPFADRLYPHALEAIEHLGTLGQPVVLSDGDVVFQPRKIQRSGIWNAVEGRVLIYVHKERALDAMRRRYPARRYVMVDDKALLLSAMKRVLRLELTTVFVHQGHYAAQYAAQSANTVIDPPPDLEIERIGDLLDHDLSDFLAVSPIGVTATNQERT